MDATSLLQSPSMAALLRLCHLAFPAATARLAEGDLRGLLVPPENLAFQVLCTHPDVPKLCHADVSLHRATGVTPLSVQCQRSTSAALTYSILIQRQDQHD